MNRGLIVVLFVCLFLLYSCDPVTLNRSKEDSGVLEYAKEKDFTVKDSDVKNIDPGILYAYANNLYSKGKLEDAVFWYYIAQYRRHFYTNTVLDEEPLSENYAKKLNKEAGVKSYAKIIFLAPPTRAQLYGSLSHEKDVSVNEFAIKYLDGHKDILDKVIAYETENPCNLGGFASASKFVSADVISKERENVKNSLLNMKNYIQDDCAVLSLN